MEKTCQLSSWICPSRGPVQWSWGMAEENALWVRLGLLLFWFYPALWPLALFSERKTGKTQDGNTISSIRNAPMKFKNKALPPPRSTSVFKCSSTHFCKFSSKNTFMRNDQRPFLVKLINCSWKHVLWSFFWKGSIPTMTKVCLDTKATPTQPWVQIFIPTHASKKSWWIIFTWK